MFFTSPLFQIPMLTGIIFLGAGLVLYLFPPKKINSLYGYRTKRSMRSQEAWDYAQRFSSRQLIYLGLALMAASTLSVIIVVSDLIGVALGLGLMLIGVINLFLRVERALKDQFNS